MVASSEDTLAAFPTSSPLRIETIDRALIELLDAVSSDHVPALARREMHEFYDRYQSNRAYFLHHFSPFFALVDQIFRPRDTNPHLLDLGCGVGTQAYLLASRGAQVTGLDNNQGRVEAGKLMADWFSPRFASSDAGQHANADRPDLSCRVQLHAVDAFSYLEQFAPESFDGVFTQFALAYMRPHRRMLELIDRVLKPEGCVVFREFNAGSLYNRTMAKVDWLNAQQYQQAGDELGWNCTQATYHWLMPKPVVKVPGVRRVLGPAEDWLTSWPVIGANLAASMTVVFRKAPSSR